MSRYGFKSFLFFFMLEFDVVVVVCFPGFAKLLLTATTTMSALLVCLSDIIYTHQFLGKVRLCSYLYLPTGIYGQAK